MNIVLELYENKIEKLFRMKVKKKRILRIDVLVNKNDYEIL